MTKVFLIVAAIADLALAALLIGVSGFMFGGGPESLHASGFVAVLYAGAVAACIAAPVAGFMLTRNGKGGLGLVLA